MEEVSTISFFRFEGLSAKAWAFKMMGLGPRQLRAIPGQTFFKMFGTGRGIGFDPLPDWGVYALLQVWENEAQADAFLANSPFIAKYRKRSSAIWTIYMRNIDVKGRWSGGVPFKESQKIDPDNPIIIAITRATLRLGAVLPFWRFVPKTLAPLRNNPGLIYSKGVGERPFVQMVTFSIWKSRASLKQFAFESHGHAKAIENSNIHSWFKESLFSHFQPYRTEGSWQDVTLNL